MSSSDLSDYFWPRSQMMYTCELLYFAFCGYLYSLIKHVKGDMMILHLSGRLFWIIRLNGFLYLFPDGIWTPKLSGRPFQHHNVQFYCISNLFKKHHDTDSKHPKKLSRAKILSFSPSHLKEHNCLSVIQLHTQKQKNKGLRNLVVFKTERKNVHSSITMVWYCSKWKYKHPTAAAATKQTFPHHTQLWAKVVTRQWSNS